MAEKTHDPTPKRIRDARARGEVPRAPLVAGAIGLIALVPLGKNVVHNLAFTTARSLMDVQPVARIDAWSIALAVIGATAPVALVLIGIAAIAGVAQGNITFSPSRLAPDPSKLEPFGGLRRLFDKSQLWNAFRGLAVALLLTWVLGRLVWTAMIAAARAPSLELAAASASRIVLVGGAIAVGFGVLDAIVGRRIWFSKLKMSRDEVMREHKEGEGDPEVKRRREELHHELLAAEALTAVRDATVIVINPTHLACALRYDDADDDAAPTLVAKGHGALAARMIEEAKLHGVPVIQDVPVARALYDLETGTEIPEALYEAVAEVLRAAWEGGD
jgi:flagellar biosynthesis protein FlhB